MTDRRLLVVGLDGFDPDLAARLAAEGRLPHLTRLWQSAARFRLDHGIEKYTGLAWEQFATGLAPAACARWSAVWTGYDDYFPTQPTTRLPPFVSDTGIQTVVFDAPYFDLAKAPEAAGIVAWGAHDPGVPPQGRPDGLWAEVEARFGPYPGRGFIYGHVWPDPGRAAHMAADMVKAVEVRADLVEWLFGERLPDWRLGLAVISEYHSATEALWYGVDETHPLHGHPSAAAARSGLLGVYEAADRMLGRLADAFPEADILAFTPHGMGRNLADVASMALLPELLYRQYTGRTALASAASMMRNPDWHPVVLPHYAIAPARGPLWPWRRRADDRPSTLDWMPSANYRCAWPEMDAYALPAFYDGRVRVNLAGREARGWVPAAHYDRVLEEVATLVAECRDAANGEPLGAEIERRPGDPFARHPTDCDLVVRFMTDHYAWDHSRLGRIGPVPCRRTGGHSGGLGQGFYLARGWTTDADLGTFPTLAMTEAVTALMGVTPAAGSLGATLLAVRSVDPALTD